MDLLKKRVGRFPLGIWVVLTILSVMGSVAILGQALSIADWDTALKLGLQEDSRASTDVVEKTIGAMEWGTAAADVLVQGPFVLLSLLGILQRRPFGYVCGVTTATIWIYATLFSSLQRIGLYRWGVVPDLSRAKYIGGAMFALCGIPAILMLVCLTANRDYFDNNLGSTKKTK